MADKYKDNRNDRSKRDEPVNDIRRQILDAEPEPNPAQDARGDRDEAGSFRPDQVPGHLGYSTSDNQINVTKRDSESTT